MNKLPIYLMAALISLYAVSATITTNGNVTYDGDFTIVNCGSNCTFNTTQTLTEASVLVVAGGGGGGDASSGAGGGGAGDLIFYNANYTIPIGNYNVIVGLGGAGAAVGSATRGVNGQNSVFNNLTAIGGGAGAGEPTTAQNATQGGSGGGGSGDTTDYKGAAAIPNGRGNPGGGAISGTNLGSGGGGAGTAGVSSTASIPGNGGSGVNISINGSTVCYAGGGGGGANSATAQFSGNGTCGGGNGGYYNGAVVPAQNATTNTGGGGGGGGRQSGVASIKAGNGASGVVILKFLTPTATITGNVSYNSTPIVGANMSLINATTFATLQTSVTNSTGGYSFSVYTTTYVILANKINSSVSYSTSRAIAVNNTVMTANLDFYNSGTTTTIYPACYQFQNGCYATMIGGNCAVVGH